MQAKRHAVSLVDVGTTSRTAPPPPHTANLSSAAFPPPADIGANARLGLLEGLATRPRANDRAKLNRDLCTSTACEGQAAPASEYPAVRGLHVQSSRDVKQGSEGSSYEGILPVYVTPSRVWANQDLTFKLPGVQTQM